MANRGTKEGHLFLSSADENSPDREDFDIEHPRFLRRQFHTGTFGTTFSCLLNQLAQEVRMFGELEPL